MVMTMMIVVVAEMEVEEMVEVKEMVVGEEVVVVVMMTRMKIL